MYISERGDEIIKKARVVEVIISIIVMQTVPWPNCNSWIKFQIFDLFIESHMVYSPSHRDLYLLFINYYMHRDILNKVINPTNLLSFCAFKFSGVQLPVNWDSAVYYTLQRPGVGMGCFAYRLHLDDKYIHQKSVLWALSCWLGSWIVNVQTNWYVYIDLYYCFLNIVFFLFCVGIFINDNFFPVI